ncbi:MAG: DMT family transporter [Candidatus Caenarcaniphilales bacterium]|nr:DMT family transporter [Candidatus Caenarcaniphilales bacterium]
MEGFICLILSCLGWSGLDICRKKLATQLNPFVFVAYLCLGQTICFGIWSFFDWHTPTAAYYLPSLISVILNCLTSVMFIHSLRLSGLSNTVPLLSLTPAVASLAAIPLLHEYPKPFEMIGMGLIVVGAFGLNLKTDLSEFWNNIWHDRGVRLMLWVALLFPLSAICDKLALQQANPAVHSFISSLGIMVVLVLAALFLHKAKVVDFIVKPELRLLVLVGAITASIGFGFQTLGFQVMHIGLFESFKRAICLIITLMSGYWVFKEEINFFKAGSVALMMGGVITMKADLINPILNHSALPH